MRARDLFLEFLPPAPTVAPTVIPAPPPFDAVSVAKDFVFLVQKTKSFPDTSPVRVALFDLFSSLKNLQPAAQNESVETNQSNMAAMNNVAVTMMTRLMERAAEIGPEEAAQMANILHRITETYGEITSDEEVQKSIIAAIKTVELNTKGEIGALDAKIEATAKEFAKRFNVKDVWARNLVGMFSVSIPQRDRDTFLDACKSGTAIDINAMIKQKYGSIDDVVSNKIPTIKQVYKSVKATLLDISLSTGQRGATGPFEAMLAIMGGADKPSAADGGDLVINGKQYEVKSTSLSPSSRLRKDGTLPNTGGKSEAWLDSGPGGEVSGSFLRKLGTDWILKMAPSLMSNPRFKEVWAKADFRPLGLPYLETVLRELDKTQKELDKTQKTEEEAGISLIAYMMSQFFPAVVSTPGFNFNNSIRRIYNAIIKNQPERIALEQGIMGLIGYMDKGNDGFILFNSSMQEYRIISGMKEVLEIYKNPSKFDIKFNTMTMGRANKASPGIYFGPDPKSERAKKYFEFYNSDPKRVALRKAAVEQEKAAEQENNQDTQPVDQPPAEVPASIQNQSRTLGNKIPMGSR
jgi:hypothetical protein